MTDVKTPPEELKKEEKVTPAPEVNKKPCEEEKPKPKPKPDPRRKLFKSDRMTIVAPAPHNKGKKSVPKIMYTVIAALMPAVIASLFLFGKQAMITILVAVFSAMVAEYLCNKIMKTGLTIDDGSAILTGLLLAMTLPPTFPIWGTALGAVVAIVFGKQVFGGLGGNVFNPAISGQIIIYGIE